MRRARRAAGVLLAAAMVALAGPAAVGCTVVKPSDQHQPTQVPSPAPGGHA